MSEKKLRTGLDPASLVDAKDEAATVLQVRCTLPHASDNINGVAFTKGISEPLSVEDYEHFLGIQGFEALKA
jgi:hypothetical protein